MPKSLKTLQAAEELLKTAEDKGGDNKKNASGSLYRLEWEDTISVKIPSKVFS